ncbi:MAG: metal-sensing transcriptional repressor [bacterium]|nr:metal-sensing transcriptional repressor [bacterium]
MTTRHAHARRKQSIDHLNRIQGQIKTLRKYMAEDKDCADVAQLTTSIAKSFDSLRARTLEGFILNELLGDRKVSSAKTKKLTRILTLHKK